MFFYLPHKKEIPCLWAGEKDPAAQRPQNSTASGHKRLRRRRQCLPDFLHKKQIPGIVCSQKQQFLLTGPAEKG